MAADGLIVPMPKAVVHRPIHQDFEKSEDP